jgi:hypothetical protein
MRRQAEIVAALQRRAEDSSPLVREQPRRARAPDFSATRCYDQLVHRHDRQHHGRTGISTIAPMTMMRTLDQGGAR